MLKRCLGSACPVLNDSVKALVTRLKKLALSPLWTETAGYKTRRRIQLLLSMPFVLLAGVTWGWFSAPAIGEGSGFFRSMMGASGFGLLFYLEHRLLRSWRHWPTASGWVLSPLWPGR